MNLLIPPSSIMKVTNLIKKYLALILPFVLTATIAQETIIKPNFLNYSMDSITKVNFDESLESLFLEINRGNIREDLLTFKRAELTKSQLQELVSFETKKDTSEAKIGDKQLINVYPISANEYFISIAYIEPNSKPVPKLLYTIHLIATKENGNFTFSIPIDYLTRHWKTETTGNITYHYRTRLNKIRAELFEKNNTEIANKLGVKPEQLDFYMCDNFQEISRLLGFSYAAHTNGRYRDGYGVDSKTIFSVVNNEDFSHDIFHYYSGQVNERINRNWITEEGIAYAWGNAYYTDKEGEMVSLDRLIRELKKYLAQNPGTSLFELFANNTKIFNHIAAEINVRSVISGIIATEVEKKKGTAGILALINAGSRDRLKNYLKLTDKLIGLNKDNFNIVVGKLIQGN